MTYLTQSLTLGFGEGIVLQGDTIEVTSFFITEVETDTNIIINLYNKSNIDVKLHSISTFNTFLNTDYIINLKDYTDGTI